MKKIRKKIIKKTKKNETFEKSKDFARGIILNSVEEIAVKHGFKYNRIAIRNQRTRLGSCSTKKNLNFNWQIVKFPKNIMEYVIKHELAHLAQPNHSSKYWEEVEKIDPNFKKHHEWIKDNAHKYITFS